MLNRRKEAYETHLQQYQGNRWGIPEKQKRRPHRSHPINDMSRTRRKGQADRNYNDQKRNNRI